MRLSQQRPQLLPWGAPELGCSRLSQGVPPLNPCTYQILDMSCALPSSGHDLELDSSLWLRAMPEKALS